MVNAGLGFQQWAPPTPPRPPGSGPRWMLPTVIVAVVLVVSLNAIALVLFLRSRGTDSVVSISPNTSTTAAAGTGNVNARPTNPGPTSAIPPSKPGLSPYALSDPCQLITPAQVAALIGASEPPARITTGGGAEECTWNGTDGKSVGLQTGDSMTQFQNRLRDSPQPLAGLGDRAAVDPEYLGKVLVLKGNTWIWVFVAGTTSDRANVINLAKAVLPEV